jgi:hypothetical protein
MFHFAFLVVAVAIILLNVVPLLWGGKYRPSRFKGGLVTVWNTLLTFFFISFTRLFFRSGSNLDPAEANETAWRTATQMVERIGGQWNWSQVPAILDNYAPRHQAVEAIPADAATYSLADGHAYTHAQEAAPIYTLPDVSAGVAHEITVEVAFSAGALSVAFEDAAGEIVPILPMAGDIAAGVVVVYLCRWSPALAAWAVMPVMEGGGDA